ncbi:hypothetical protein L2E82_11450 [Cichorium intybus]|uniref:Uncharacterized protein n=1 Tax=Cichorium intybus TaxID=13427 RepID=A0ACB9GEE4_CICIN|nr:hypothetical protein L2E82_11450 [Cichorium intybus]
MVPKGCNARTATMVLKDLVRTVVTRSKVLENLLSNLYGSERSGPDRNYGFGGLGSSKPFKEKSAVTETIIAVQGRKFYSTGQQMSRFYGTNEKILMYKRTNSYLQNVKKCFSPKFIAIHNLLCIAYNSLKHDCSGFANCSSDKNDFL